VAHIYNPIYSGGRDQEDLSSKPAPANSSQDHISKKTLHKKGLVEWLKAGGVQATVPQKEKEESKNLCICTQWQMLSKQ
jgi:hypothetical protein